MVTNQGRLLLLYHIYTTHRSVLTVPDRYRPVLSSVPPLLFTMFMMNQSRMVCSVNNAIPILSIKHSMHLISKAELILKWPPHWIYYKIHVSHRLLLLIHTCTERLTKYSWTLLIVLGFSILPAVLPSLKCSTTKAQNCSPSFFLVKKLLFDNSVVQQAGRTIPESKQCLLLSKDLTDLDSNRTQLMGKCLVNTSCTFISWMQ